MRYTPLFPGADPTHTLPQISELGFGCSALGGRTSRRDSLAALEAAYAAGITLYDTARSYGYGQSESILGEFARTRRDSLILCTKFGILPAAQGNWKQKLKPFARTAVSLFPALRKTAQRHATGQFIPGQFSLDVLRTSFETSLRELRTETVDILLLHAAPESVLQQDDLLESMGRLIEAGKLRMAGISGELPVIARYFQQRPQPLKTAQFALNLATMPFAGQTPLNADLLLIGNHPFGGPAGAAAAKGLIETLRTAPTLPADLREKLDPADLQLYPELVLNCILRGTGLAAVIPAMMQLRHLHSNVRAVQHCRFSPGELSQLRQYASSTTSDPPA
jgi:aryl-alcohol dehydrogenase-like predicted oxidoreductase